MTCKCLLAIDPGKDKCGLAVLSYKGKILFQNTVPREPLFKKIKDLFNSFHIDLIIVGNKTFSKSIVNDLKNLSPCDVKLIDEHLSSLEARKRFWKEQPPQGWRKFIPTSLLLPPTAYDDWAAVILGERYLKSVREKI